MDISNEKSNDKLLISTLMSTAKYAPQHEEVGRLIRIETNSPNLEAAVFLFELLLLYLSATAITFQMQISPSYSIQGSILVVDSGL